MRGHGVAVVKVPHLGGIEADGVLFVAVHLHVDQSAVDPVDGSEIAVRDSQLTVRRCELEAVTLGEVPAYFSVGGDSVQPLRVVGDLPPILGGNRNQVCCGFDGGYDCVAARLDAMSSKHLFGKYFRQALPQTKRIQRPSQALFNRTSDTLPAAAYGVLPSSGADQTSDFMAAQGRYLPAVIATLSECE